MPGSTLALPQVVTRPLNGLNAESLVAVEEKRNSAVVNACTTLGNLAFRHYCLPSPSH
jgi:hypothetical protein